MSWTATTESLAENLPGYEARVEQDRLAITIEDAFADGEHLLGQAGCGTGKSFAYLATAVDHARTTRKPVVVATATKALQSQLADKDLPFLVSILGDFSYAVLKGRSNYVCLAKANAPEAQQVLNLKQVLTELDEIENHSGDLDEFVTEILPQDRSKLAVVGDECVGRADCPFGDVCLAEKAKQRAADSQIVVANHAVLMRDLAIKELTDGKGGMLPHYGAVVIDEAHELEEYATGALGTDFGQRALERLGDDVATFLKDKDAGRVLRAAAVALFATLSRMISERDSTKRLDDGLLIEVFEELELALKAAKGLREQIRAFHPADDTQALAKKRIRNRVQGMHDRLSSIMLSDADDLVRWIEREERVIRGQKEISIKLAYAPLHVGPYLARTLWSHTPAILVSATLAIGEDFSFIAGRLGLTDYRSFDAGSPFDFPKQAGLYIPQAAPLGTFPEDPKSSSWQARMTAEAGELIRAAGGRTLFLFTSRRSMESTYAALAPMLKGMKVRALKQGDMPNGRIAQEFTNDETSVLFALKSFMTGADFQGDTCRLLIVDKLPFPVPSDVIFQARAEAIDAVATSWNAKSFMKLSIPAMTLTLLQAFGRAVRTKNDRAVIAIFDSRLLSKSYGKTIVRALPPAQKLVTLADAQTYLAELA